MFTNFYVILIGLLGGVSVGLQAPIAGAMSQKLGGAAGSFIVHLGGAILSGVLLFFRGGEKIREWSSLPWYMLGSGFFGLILYLTISYTLPRLGSATMVALIIVGQLLMGILIDQFGWFGVQPHPVSGGRIIGILLLMAGGYLISR
jgi:transporter family-2 protein